MARQKMPMCDSSNMYVTDPMVTVSPFAAPLVFVTLTVPVPYVPFSPVKVSVLEPFLMVIVWPEVGAGAREGAGGRRPCRVSRQG